MLTRIALYRLTRRGERGWLLTIPASWVREQGIKPSARMDVFQDTDGSLVIRPADGACIDCAMCETPCKGEKDQ